MVEYKKLSGRRRGFARACEHWHRCTSGSGRHSSGVSSQPADQLLQKAKDLALQHPGLTQAAVMGLAGLLFKNRKKGLAAASCGLAD